MYGHLPFPDNGNVQPRSVRPNEAEYGTPRVSDYGARFKAGILGTQPRYGYPEPVQTALMPQDYIAPRRAGLVREMEPLIAPNAGSTRFLDFIGAFAARTALIRPVVPTQRYLGQLPTDQQPTIRKPYPWLQDLRTQGRP